MRERGIWARLEKSEKEMPTVYAFLTLYKAVPYHRVEGSKKPLSTALYVRGARTGRAVKGEEMRKG